ncbi:hypothetical protein EJ994_10270 [Maribacter sp. MJ134]|uniref:glycoside hydrolase family 78 protein n=1 Tax=Maribacter sp. MJ134 TaxID=2496865 RepID=UPI000F8410C2|nr:alpha-L-rhamnosidase N-terminal domain-containing protein [Maribacter sp. MJ134]AZQ59170.1 hypothetical protein EJ994_10270 [Maribacter sp. MJ134]
MIPTLRNTPIKMKMAKFVMAAMALFLSSCSTPSELAVTDLECEYKNNPLGIDNTQPRLSWKLVAPNFEREQKQTAYQVLVASNIEALDKNARDIWDSGKVSSNQSVNVVYNGGSLQSTKTYYWKVKVWDAVGNPTAWSPSAKFSMGLLQPEDWQGEWIYKEGQNKKDHNWYRKNFTLDTNPESAYIYVASFGYHEVYVNGKKVSDAVMNPVLSYKKKRLPYLTYDIKEHLTKGDNVISIWHAAGWARWGRMKEYYDSPFVFKAQAQIETDTTNLTLVTDDTWKCKKSYSSYIGSWDILDFGGEIIDERLREDDWNTVGYDDDDWANAVVFDNDNAKEIGFTDINLGPKGAIRAPSTDANPPTTKITATLSAQMVEPQVRFKEIKPIGVAKKEDGKYIIDMGENYTGHFEMNLFNGKEGDTITFEVADHKEVTSPWEQRSHDVFDKTGGRAIHLADANEAELSKALAMGLTPDVAFSPNPTLGSDFGKFNYIHKIKEGRHIYFFSNSSDEDIETQVRLKGDFTLFEANPHTGTISPLTNTTKETLQKEVITKAKLTLPAVSAVFWRSNEIPK